jgi:hypothetical protein
MLEPDRGGYAIGLPAASECYSARSKVRIETICRPRPFVNGSTRLCTAIEIVRRCRFWAVFPHQEQSDPIATGVLVPRERST